MPDSDRKKVKDQEKGTYLTAAGISNAARVVNECHQETFEFDVPSDAAVAEIGFCVEKACRIVSAYGLAVTGLAANGSAYITQTIRKRDGAGGAAVSAATFDTNTAGQNKSITAWVKYPFTLSTTTANRDIPAGGVITFQSAETGTPTTPIAKVSVTVEYGVL